MAYVAGHVLMIGVMGMMIIFENLRSLQAVPINPVHVTPDSDSGQHSGETNTEYKFRNMVTIIFVNSCNGKELSYSIENIRGDCYNVQLNNINQVIKTEPGDIKLYLFEKPGCTGKQIEYTSGSFSSQLDADMPFLPASFAMARR